MGQTLGDQTEATLVTLAALGDQRAFGELVRRRHTSLRAMMRRLSGDGTLADDLAQEALVQAWRSLGQLKNAAAFGGWLKQIAIRVWLQHARRSKLLLESLDEADDEPTPPVTQTIDLNRALERLSARQRLCVVLCHAEGLSHQEIVEATGWPLGTVKAHVARGSTRLKKWLGS